MNSTNTIKIVRGLILWSVSTGVLTWYVCRPTSSFFEFYLNIECRVTGVLFLLSVTLFFWKFQILSHNTFFFFTGFGFWTFWLHDLFCSWWSWVISSFFFCSPRMVDIKPCFFKSTQTQCLHSTFLFYFKYLAVFIKAAYFLPIVLGRLNARTRFRAMAEASIPLNSISLDETSSSQPVDRDLQQVRIWSKFFFFFVLLKVLNFC